MIAEIYSNNGCKKYRISFEFQAFNDSTVLFVKDLCGDTPSYTYQIGYDPIYQTSYGAWKYSFEYKNWHFVDALGKDKWRLATIIRMEELSIEQNVINECGVPREYYMQNDMMDASNYAISTLTQDIAPSKELLEKAKDALFAHNPWYDEFNKEGGNVMYKYLFHIILFNKDTESIDFKEYISAKEASDAMMYAAQTYGKYNPNIHVVIVKKIENSQYEVEE